MAARVYVGSISPTLSEKDLEDEVPLILCCARLLLICPALTSCAVALTQLPGCAVYQVRDAQKRVGGPQASRCRSLRNRESEAAIFGNTSSSALPVCHLQDLLS